IVTLENSGAGAVQARWNDAGVPQVRAYAAPDPEQLPPFPAEPAAFTGLEAGFLQALDAAGHTAAREQVRYALSRLQLRGSRGEVVATDGRQVLIQGGFA